MGKKVKKEFSSSNPSPSKKIKTNFGTPPKVPKTNFGTPPKVPNADFAAPSNIDGYLTQNPDGGVSCNVCGKVVSCMSSARRHYKTTHEEIEPTPCPLGCGLEFKNPTSLENHLKNVHSVMAILIKREPIAMETYAAGDFDNPSNADNENDHKETGGNEDTNEGNSGFLILPNGKVQCPKCPKILSKIGNAIIHDKSVHDETKVNCPLC